MAVGRIEIVLGYTGPMESVLASLEEALAMGRQRALTSQAGFPGTAGEVQMWGEAVVFEDGEKIRVGVWHVDPDAPDADGWGVVDGRLPNEFFNGDPVDPGEPGDDPGDVAEWVEPTGDSSSWYNTGDRVLFEGQVYESTLDSNVYAPGVVAGAWVLV
jgi:hypothetical protein